MTRQKNINLKKVIQRSSRNSPRSYILQMLFNINTSPGDCYYKNIKQRQYATHPVASIDLSDQLYQYLFSREVNSEGAIHKQVIKKNRHSIVNLT